MNSFKNKWLVALLACCFVVGSAWAATEKSKEKSKGYQEKLDNMILSDKNTTERTLPIGSVFQKGDNVPVAAPPPKPKHTGPRTGEMVYDMVCKTCHSGAIPNAPKFGDPIWNELVSSRGAEALLQSAIVGTANGMPPKGTCMDCSDKELSDAVQFMIDSAK